MFVCIYMYTLMHTKTLCVLNCFWTDYSNSIYKTYCFTIFFTSMSICLPWKLCLSYPQALSILYFLSLFKMFNV